AYAYVDQALELAGGRAQSRARAHALVARAAYHMLASEHPQAIRLAREALPLTEALGLDDLRARAFDVLGASRVFCGDVEGLDDSQRAIALAHESNAFSQLVAAECNLYENQFSLGQLAAASETLSTLRGDGAKYGTAIEQTWVHAVEAHDALIHGRWDTAIRLLDQLIAEFESGAPNYLDPACRRLRATIELARGDLERALADSHI